jgi:hypothetical protein
VPQNRPVADRDHRLAGSSFFAYMSLRASMAQKKLPGSSDAEPGGVTPHCLRHFDSGAAATAGCTERS